MDHLPLPIIDRMGFTPDEREAALIAAKNTGEFIMQLMNTRPDGVRPYVIIAGVAEVLGHFASERMSHVYGPNPTHAPPPWTRDED